MNAKLGESNKKKYNNITITIDKGRLNKGDIDRIVKDADTYRLEDEKEQTQFDRVAHLNSIYKIVISTTDEAYNKSEEARDRLNKPTIFHSEKECEKRQKELNGICHVMIEKLYNGGVPTFGIVD